MELILKVFTECIKLFAAIKIFNSENLVSKFKPVEFILLRCTYTKLVRTIVFIYARNSIQILQDLLTRDSIIGCKFLQQRYVIIDLLVAKFTVLEIFECRRGFVPGVYPSRKQRKCLSTIGNNLRRLGISFLGIPDLQVWYLLFSYNGSYNSGRFLSFRKRYT